MLQNVYIFLPYITTARTVGVDRNEEITICIITYSESKWLALECSDERMRDMVSHTSDMSRWGWTEAPPLSGGPENAGVGGGRPRGGEATVGYGRTKDGEGTMPPASVIRPPIARRLELLASSASEFCVMHTTCYKHWTKLDGNRWRAHVRHGALLTKRLLIMCSHYSRNFWFSLSLFCYIYCMLPFFRCTKNYQI